MLLNYKELLINEGFMMKDKGESIFLIQLSYE